MWTHKDRSREIVGIPNTWFGVLRIYLSAPAGISVKGNRRRREGCGYGVRRRWEEEEVGKRRSRGG
jgi:hypothetical protein